MKKEKLVISLIVMIVLLFAFTVNTLATGDSSITVRPQGTNSALTPTTGNSSTLTPSSNSSISIGGGNTASAGANRNQTINPGNSTDTGNSVGAGSSSSYRNLAASTNTDNKAGGLPYTGSKGYGIVFIIIALGVSAVYAYKKVSDYNM